MTDRRAVYTCLFGHSEAFADRHYEGDAHTDFICFTDDPGLRSSFWDMRLIRPVAMDPARAAKRYKHCFFEALPDYAASLYIDNTVELLQPPGRIFPLLGQAPLMLFRHPWRDCIYDEAQVLVDAGIDVPAVTAQMRLYRRLGHPAHAGLHATTAMLRDHRSTLLAPVMREWHLQTVRHSFRDQLSLPVVTRLLGLDPAHFPGELNDNALLRWPVVKDGFRLPRDFDDERYYALHPDVEAAGMNAREHYFKHGAAEGRAYKRMPPVRVRARHREG